MSIFHLKCQTVCDLGGVDEVILNDIFWNHPKNFLAVNFLDCHVTRSKNFESLFFKKRPCIEMHKEMHELM